MKNAYSTLFYKSIILTCLGILYQSPYTFGMETLDYSHTLLMNNYYKQIGILQEDVVEVMKDYPVVCLLPLLFPLSNDIKNSLGFDFFKTKIIFYFEILQLSYLDILENKFENNHTVSTVLESCKVYIVMSIIEFIRTTYKLKTTELEVFINWIKEEIDIVENNCIKCTDVFSTIIKKCFFATEKLMIKTKNQLRAMQLIFLNEILYYFIELLTLAQQNEFYEESFFNGFFHEISDIFKNWDYDKRNKLKNFSTQNDVNHMKIIINYFEEHSLKNIINIGMVGLMFRITRKIPMKIVPNKEIKYLSNINNF